MSRDGTLALTVYVDRGGDQSRWVVNCRLAHPHDGGNSWDERLLSNSDMQHTATAEGLSGRECCVGEYRGLFGVPRGFVSVFV